MREPGLSSYSLQDDSMLDFRGQVVSTVITTRGQIILYLNAMFSSTFTSYCVIDFTDDENLGT